MSSKDTTASTVPAEPHDTAATPGQIPITPSPPPPPAPERGRARWPWILGGSFAFVVAVAVVVLGVIDARTFGIDDYVLSPGSATTTESAIRVDGAETFEAKGEIAFTTVSISRDVKLWDWLLAKWDDSSDLVPGELVDGTRTSDEARVVNQFQMNQSQDTATLVALNFLGYEIVPEIESAFVTQLEPGSPAAGVLQLGDLIVSVDDLVIASPSDLADAVRALSPGDDVRLEIHRAVAPNGDGSDADAEAMTVSATLAEHPDIPNAGFLGVSIETPIRADAPFDVSFDVGRVRGPSAGLAFSLAILDLLTPGELTGGHKVATTGTIDRNGIVGQVGGVRQKTEAAMRAHIDAFLVPPSEYRDALTAAAGQLEVRCVQTFGDAVLVLAEDFGGNGLDVVDERGLDRPQLSPRPVDPDDGFLSCAEAAQAG